MTGAITSEPEGSHEPMNREAVLVAGANGAGKTTFVRQFLRVRYPEAVFLNADEISREGETLLHPVAVGRELLRRLARAETLGGSFVLETTLSTRMYVRRLAAWAGLGYRTSLHFIELPSAEHAIRRVAARVAAGGHHVPDADVIRRFHRGLRLFHDVYKSELDEWYHWRSDDGGLRLVERRRRP